MGITEINEIEITESIVDAVITTPLSSSTRKTSDTYARVVFVNGRYRVAVCRDSLQWLFQQRVTIKTCAGARWRNLGYCLTKKSLMRLQHKYQGVVSPELQAFPDLFRLRPRGNCAEALL